MYIKRSGGKIFGATLTAAEKRAMDIEIRRQIVEADEKYTNDIDALVLYTLHTHLGFGKKRLRRFWDAFKIEHEKLIKHYEMPDDGAWLCRHFLMEIGVDVVEWNKEDKDNENQTH